jgi:hypothetical protein
MGAAAPKLGPSSTGEWAGPVSKMGKGIRPEPVLSPPFIVSKLEPSGSGLESSAYLPVWLQAVRAGQVGNCRVGQVRVARQVVAILSTVCFTRRACARSCHQLVRVADALKPSSSQEALLLVFQLSQEVLDHRSP